MSSTGSSTVLVRNSDLESVETTPLILSSDSQSTSRKIRSYTNNFSIYSKRRLHPKARAFKSHDKLHIHAVKENGDNGDQGHSHDQSAPSFTTLLSPSNTSQDDSTASQSSCEPTERVSSPSSSLHLPKHRKGLMPSISLTLENSGSVARDHLASERTFLAYVRTSLAIASSGVALVQLFTVASANLGHSPEHRLHTYIRPLGAMTIIMGLVVLILGVVRYFSVQAALTKGTFPVARAVTGFITMTLTFLIIVTFGIMVAGKLEPPKGKPRH